MELYQQAGVDPDQAEILLKKMKDRFIRTHNSKVIPTRSGYASLYQISPGRLIAASCDGVGTKLLLAKECNQLTGLGQDLLAMSVNDLICSGARPLFFMDYLAMGQLETKQSEELLTGIVQACERAKIPLIGGETAEMPGLYRPGDFDLVGMAIGELDTDQLIDGENIQPQDTIIALPSSGFHSNGFALIRKLTSQYSIEDKAELLAPTRLYHHSIGEILKHERLLIKAMAHITGAGLHNIARMNRRFDYHLQYSPEESGLVGRWLKRWNMSEEQAAEIFNLGLGLVLVSASPQALISSLQELGESPIIIGKVFTGNGRIRVEGARKRYELSGKKGA